MKSYSQDQPEHTRKHSPPNPHRRLTRTNLNEKADDESEEEKGASNGTSNRDNVGDVIELALEAGVFWLVTESFMITR